MANTVDLIDPIDSLTNLSNGTPEYEKLFIFAELLGRRRERSVLTLNTKDKETTLETTLSNTNVNMMGVDFNKEVSNTAKFTTKWTDNNTNQTKTLEGFGITNISVKINSSFIPVVTIDFIDIRGMTFFNLGENSPYSMLFDFPPPIFDLTLKGYYGKSLTYQLHLLKHNTKFDSKTGNYNISVEFVARTFAPLADIPFKYVELLSLIYKDSKPSTDPKIQESGQQDNINPINQDRPNFDPRVAPKNTYELVEKFKRLTDELKDLKNTSTEAKEFEDAKIGVESAKDISRKIDFFSGNIDPIFKNIAKIIIKNDGNDFNDNTVDNGGEFRIVAGSQSYADLLKASGTEGDNSNNLHDRLYLGVLINKVRDNNIEKIYTGTTETLFNTLEAYTQSLFKSGELFSEDIKRSDISTPINIINNQPENTEGNSHDIYIGLDITKFYIKFYKTYNKKVKLVDSAQSNLVKLVNSKLKKILGFNPTIYNIFKVLCDDIDKFFKVLGEVTYSAELHHNNSTNYDIMVDLVKEEKTKKQKSKLHAFPLYVEEDITCNVSKKVRRIPKFELPEPLPEVSFVDDFIAQMIKIKKEERVNDMKTNVDVTGNNKWIPISPVDSELHLDTYESPYTNLARNPNDTNDYVFEIYKRLLNRFYIASQFTYGESFYNLNSTFLWIGDHDIVRNNYIDFIAKSEAINVANSLIENSLIDSLTENSKTFKSDLTQFYKQLSELPQFSSIGNTLLISDDTTQLYRDRRDESFQGMEILDESPIIRRQGDDNDTISKFLDKEDGFSSAFFRFFNGDKEKKIKTFSLENIPFFPDYEDESDAGDNYATKFLNNIELNKHWAIFGNDEINKYTNIFGEGVSTDIQAGIKIDPAGKNANGNYVETLSSILSIYYKEINIFIDSSYSIEAKSFILASMFGRARSYFSKLGFYDGVFSSNVGSVNSRFSLPGVVEVPRFSIYYMGGLIEYIKNPSLKIEIDAIFNEEWFSHISIKHKYMKQDIDKINLLSEIDKNTFSDAYYNWNDVNKNGGYRRYRDDLEKLISDFIIKITNDPEDYTDAEDYQKLFETLIDDGNMPSINEDMMSTTGILNYSEYTFMREDVSKKYIPLSKTNLDINGNDSLKAANDRFFKAFWGALELELGKVRKNLNEIDREFNNSIDDNDIKTQLYYSFKNISDKWIAGINTKLNGFPLNVGEGDSLIKKFAFVDRAMNPIGDEVIINAEAIVEMSKDYDLNMFQVFSRLLSQNGFEFFPLQNFMPFSAEDGVWEDSFKTQTTLEQKATPAFVCMYIGGTSSILENPSSAFDNDGITDLNGEGIPDFNNNNECNESREVDDSKTRTKLKSEARFKYSEPKAFRVRFGEQNQSFFTDIQLEGRDFTETTDSLAILSRIAGDGKTSTPIPKGQNLFNLYENRAYSVKIKMLGNVMIQPTQYFQLENIPMYSGAYMILNVTHTVTANHMVTEFEGIKVLKFPNPYVKDFATIVGIEGGTAGDLTATTSTETGMALSAGELPNIKLLVNDMFDLSISP